MREKRRRKRRRRRRGRMKVGRRCMVYGKIDR